MAKITDNSSELSFHQLTSTSAMLLVPLFQRPYVWTKKQLDRMHDEIQSIVDKKDTSRFLGAVIAVTRPTNPSQPTPYEIVDGQQRLTTLYLILLAAAQVAAREGHTEFARGLISTNLIVDWAQELDSNTKLQPSIGDRGQFKKIFDTVSNTGELSDWLPVKARVPASVGDDTGPLLRQFKQIQSWLRKLVSDKGLAALEGYVDAARHGLTFVFILLKDPGSATTVFEGLNDPGIPIAVGDLVKNEVFSRVGYNEKEAQTLHDHKWAPFRDRFGGTFNDFFFPYCVIYRTSASRTEMFSELRALWKEKSAREIILELEAYANTFLALKGDPSAINSYGREVGIRIQRLVDLKHPSSTYPFLMKLLKALENSTVRMMDVCQVLDTIESFLVRRAIAGIEPTGLLGMFRTMWAAMDEHPTAKKVESVILKRLTVEWPSDVRIEEAIKTRPIYGSAIARYLVIEYDKSLGQDQPTNSEWSIEHIMPRSYCHSWQDAVSKSDHKILKDLWANLVPLSKGMNGYVDQSPFCEKREIFAQESMFVSARRVGQDYDTWTATEIGQRSDTLVVWARTRWPRPTGKEPV